MAPRNLILLHAYSNPMPYLLCLLALLAAAGPTPGAAQTASDPDRALTIARVQYDGGGDWYVGPSTLPNLLHEIRQRTGIPVASRPVSLRLTDPRLQDHPFLFLTGHGNIDLSDTEIAALRRFLLSGGFLYADDCYGMDEAFRREIARVFPDKPLVEVPHDHPIYSVVYPFTHGPPKIHEHDGKPPQGFGIFHQGRLMVYYTYESDLHDGWEDAQVHGNPPELREKAFRMGVNIFVYALSQSVR
jgi:hypothetical protein